MQLFGLMLCPTGNRSTQIEQIDFVRNKIKWNLLFFSRQKKVPNRKQTCCTTFTRTVLQSIQLIFDCCVTAQYSIATISKANDDADDKKHAIFCSIIELPRLPTTRATLQKLIVILIYADQVPFILRIISEQSIKLSS